jgi:hypothetical protein
VLAVGYAFEQVFKGRLQPDPGIAEDNMAGDFDIQAFNRLKREIAHESYGSLQLADDRRTYIHPTADEFRTLVRQITARLRQGYGGQGARLGEPEVCRSPHLTTAG